VPTPVPTSALRGYQRCVCVTEGIAGRIARRCPEVHAALDGELCLPAMGSNAQLYALVKDCPFLHVEFMPEDLPYDGI